MKKYTGTKTVSATPMTRGNYYKFKNAQIHPGEDGDEEGYIVEYLDDDMPSGRPYTSNVSWVARDEFNLAYKVIQHD
jgi:hypothetical protein